MLPLRRPAASFSRSQYCRRRRITDPLFLRCSRFGAVLRWNDLKEEEDADGRGDDGPSCLSAQPCSAEYLVGRRVSRYPHEKSGIHKATPFLWPQGHHQQHRAYHATPRREIIMYSTIIVSVAIGYVLVRKWRGEPLTPEHLTSAKEEYQRLERERLQRNQQRGQSRPSLQQPAVETEEKTPEKKLSAKRLVEDQRKAAK